MRGSPSMLPILGPGSCAPCGGPGLPGSSRHPGTGSSHYWQWQEREYFCGGSGSRRWEVAEGLPHGADAPSAWVPRPTGLTSPNQRTASLRMSRWHQQSLQLQGPFWDSCTPKELSQRATETRLANTKTHRKGIDSPEVFLKEHHPAETLVEQGITGSSFGGTKILFTPRGHETPQFNQ